MPFYNQVFIFLSSLQPKPTFINFYSGKTRLITFESLLGFS